MLPSQPTSETVPACLSPSIGAADRRAIGSWWRPFAAETHRSVRACGRLFRRELLRASLLAAVTAVIWIAHFDRWTAESWHIPTQYFGDAHEMLVRIQASAEGDLGLFGPQVISRLGAPFGAHWNAYPTPDKLLMSVLGALVPHLGLFATANIGLVLAQISAALAFYLVARFLRCRWEWAVAGALIFAYSYHTFQRGLAHFSLLFSWTVPVGLLAAWLVARSMRLEWRRPGAALALFAGVALGMSNPYNLFFWLQLMGWALIVQLIGRRRRANFEIGVATIALALATCVVTNIEHWLQVDDTAARPLLLRNYAGTEQYALKPVEMFIPPAQHRWDFLAAFGRHYVSWSNWRGEAITSYLGLVGIAGLCWLLAVAAHRALAGRKLPLHALALCWLVAFSAVGGITNLLALFGGLQIFRATNRVALFLSAIVVWWLVAGLSRLTRRLPAALRVAAATSVAGFAVLDQLPRPIPGKIDAVRQAVRSDQDFGARLEAALQPRSMVFQLPQLDFPEVEPPYRLKDYEHFRPYLATRTLRFTYGVPRARARGRWQRDLRNAPPAVVVRSLDTWGFAALYLNRKGYADAGRALLQQLANLGYHRRIDSRDGEQVAVLLHPQPHPQLPVGRQLTVARGWKIRPDDGAPWAYDAGALSLFNPYPHPITIKLQMTLVSRMHRRLALELNGRRLQGVDVPACATHVELPQVTVDSGINHFWVRSRESPAEQQGVTNEERAFGLRETEVSLVAAADRPP
jgi:hypothetical protein